MSNAKKAAAQKAVSLVEDGMIVGLGTGSTAYWAIEALGEKVAQGLKIKAVASSVASEEQAKQKGISIIDFASFTAIDIGIDGADEVDENNNLIKGGGGALLREKILAYHAEKFLVIVDESKLVKELGAFKLPVEIVPFAKELTLNKLTALGGKPVVRIKEGAPFITDNGNLIADCSFFPIRRPDELNATLHALPGVVETGLFPSAMVSKVIVGKEDGSVWMK